MTRFCTTRFFLLLFHLRVSRAQTETQTAPQLTARLLAQYGSTDVHPALAKQTNESGACAGNAPPTSVQTQVYVDQFEPLDTLKRA